VCVCRIDDLRARGERKAERIRAWVQSHETTVGTSGPERGRFKTNYGTPRYLIRYSDQATSSTPWTIVVRLLARTRDL
jgi:hypothetical protein